MIGDKLLISDYHRKGALKIMQTLNKRWADFKNTIAISIAGESGSGKSEIAHCLADNIKATGKNYIILCQDDYFKLPPKTNHKKRIKDINWVGPGEVQLDILDAHIYHLKNKPYQVLEKPLVYFEEDCIKAEIIHPGAFDVIIVEGTYTSLLKNIDIRVFINRNYKDTKKNRLKRSRDPDLEFIEKILEIEHKEIFKHKRLADIIIDAP